MEELRALPSVQQKSGRWINIRPLLTAARCSEWKAGTTKMSEREISFKGGRVDNGEWIEGGFVPSLNGKRFYIGNMFECVEIVPLNRQKWYEDF